jgi:hypothetical protein
VVDIIDDGFVSKITKNQAKSVVNYVVTWVSETVLVVHAWLRWIQVLLCQLCLCTIRLCHLMWGAPGISVATVSPGVIVDLLDRMFEHGALPR